MANPARAAEDSDSEEAWHLPRLPAPPLSSLPPPRKRRRRRAAIEAAAATFPPSPPPAPSSCASPSLRRLPLPDSYQPLSYHALAPFDEWCAPRLGATAVRFCDASVEFARLDLSSRAALARASAPGRGALAAGSATSAAAALRDDGSVLHWRPGQPVARLPPPPASSPATALATSGPAVACAYGADIFVWWTTGAAAAAPPARLRAPAPVVSLELSDTLLCAALFSGRAALYRVPGLVPLPAPAAARRRLFAARARPPAGRSVLLTSADGSARVVSSATGRLAASGVRVRGSRARSVSSDPSAEWFADACWSPCGGRVALLGDRRAAVFDAGAGSTLAASLPAELLGPAAFSPCGRYLCASDPRGGAAVVWDTMATPRHGRQVADAVPLPEELALLCGMYAGMGWV